MEVPVTRIEVIKIVLKNLKGNVILIVQITVFSTVIMTSKNHLGPSQDILIMFLAWRID